MSRFGRKALVDWPLDPAIIYLNHGTVGVTPNRVLEAQAEIRREIERRPAQFLLRELSEVAVGSPRAEPPRLRVAAERVARFLGATGMDLAFVDNATTAINAVLRSMSFQPGDEIIIGDHAYGAIRYSADFRARETGARVRVVEIPGPPYAPAQVLAAFDQALTEARGRCRLAIVDHVTSESALVLPTRAIVERCRAQGVSVLVDGAHAPGAIEVDITSMGADWYAANLHKWEWSPRSCGILWAARERQEGLHPPVISWGLDRGFTTEFDWVGTRDPSAALAAPVGIDCIEEAGAKAVREYNHRLAWHAGTRLAERWGTRLPVSKEMVGTMVTLPMPERLGATPDAAASVRDRLLVDHRIEVQVHAWRESLWVRVSAQVYNDEEDIERLAEAVLNLK
ncbi:MAG TPA: aminotransferase class V-fold PLP-dependent enzyme [Candidatus Eisenbacteria bacterium]|jgi:isopenicillin-N epimerase|nr:aminotransferase class V-fold PLP-dependent enzyme [Candidatus Eisenbacteria bacterium]